MSFQEFADLSLAGQCLTREQCHRVLECRDEDILALLDAAYRVRRRAFGNQVRVQVLTNAKSGLCPEDCRYCSQSSASTAQIEKYPLVSSARLLEDARAAKQTGAWRFCMALSGRNVAEKEMETLCAAIRAIKAETGIPLCCSLGFVSSDQARRLRQAGLDRVNHNLNTGPRFYDRICTTHTYQDRLDNVARCKGAGLEICCGGIIGQGESDDDIIDMLLDLREIAPQAIPINFLIPIEGTPFENVKVDLDPLRCLKALCLARFLHPQCEIRAAGGREYHLRSLQPLAFYPADSIFASGYLTTGGQPADEAFGMIADAGFERVAEGNGLEP